MIVKTSFGDNYYFNTLETYLQIDESLNMLIIGKTTNKCGIIEELLIENSHILSCSLKLGNMSMDNYGRFISEELWIKCDFNDRKNMIKHPDGSLSVEKLGVKFSFGRKNSDDTLNLQSVHYRIEILPKTLAKKSIPIHLFGELAKTPMGVNIIEEYDILNIFIKEIRNSDSALLQKRASLWGIAHIGSSEFGLELLLKAEILPHLISLAENSECLSLRGTSLYALGLISKTIKGKRALEKYDWQSHSQPGAIVCLPKNMTKFFTIAPLEYKGDFTENKKLWKNFDEIIGSYNFTEESQRVLKLIGNLSNHVTQKNAIPELRKISQKNPEIFMDIQVFHCVVLILSNYTFKLQVRRYIYLMFDKLTTSRNFLTDYIGTTENLNEELLI